METASGNMCRCCASEGVFKDLATTYHWMGEEEIYGDMLRECFDIQLSSMENADGGICEVCITQLRNASNFKKQVLLTEEQFKSHLQNVFKPGIVKVEVTRDEGNSTDDNATDDGMSGPEFDDIPIKIEGTTKNEKEDLEIKPKKRSSVKPSTSTAKKSVSSDDEPLKKRIGWDFNKSNVSKTNILNLKSLSSSRIQTTVATNSRSTLKPIRTREIDKHMHNVKTILVTSNATPIQYFRTQYKCWYCFIRYPLPADLKKHILKKHGSYRKEYVNGHSLNSCVDKLDVTGLQCSLCEERFETLQIFTNHIQASHDCVFYTDIKNHILPFKFDQDLLFCAVCDHRFDSFKIMQQHMSVHYRNFVCTICESAFITKDSYKVHMKGHEVGEHKCPKCDKTYNNATKRNSHYKTVHVYKQKRNRCPHCVEKFKSIATRTAHMEQVHGIAPTLHKCGACDNTYNDRRYLIKHIRRHHLMERNQECDQCDMKFFSQKELVMHKLKHTGAKPHKCHLCSKAFSRKHTLTEHLRIHYNDRRFKCPHCELAFIQKCTLKLHVQNKHKGLDDTVH